VKQQYQSSQIAEIENLLVHMFQTDEVSYHHCWVKEVGI
jgi:hypothetical protein